MTSTLVAPRADVRPDLLEAFTGKVLNDLGAAASGALVVVHERLWRFVGYVPFVGSLGLLPGTYRLEARTDSGSQVTHELKIDAAIVAQPLRLELR